MADCDRCNSELVSDDGMLVCENCGLETADLTDGELETLQQVANERDGAFGELVNAYLRGKV